MESSSELALSRYLRMVREIPKFSRARELELLRRWRDQSDLAAKEQIFCANLHYPVIIAMKYGRFGLPLSYLIAEGNLGVLQGIEAFDPERQDFFGAHVAFWIRVHILSYIIRSWSLFGVSHLVANAKSFFELRGEWLRVTGLLSDANGAEYLPELAVPNGQINVMMRHLEARGVFPEFEASASPVRSSRPSGIHDVFAASSEATHHVSGAA
jgi:DNA-directed RNA polymerase sigma subunit (sigma70/sigma32)